MREEPYLPLSTELLDSLAEERVQTVPLTFLRSLKVWWSITWRLFAFAVLLIAASYLLSRTPIGEFYRGRVPAELSILGGVLLLAIINAFIIRRVLKKRYSDFKLALLRVSEV